MKIRPALTLVELVLTISIIAILAAGVMPAYATARQRYALKLSGDKLVSELVRAHIYSREEKDEKSWGIRIIDENNYALVNRGSTGENVIFSYILQDRVIFTTPALEIWFDQGTGNTARNENIGLISASGNTRIINVTQNGVVTSI